MLKIFHLIYQKKIRNSRAYKMKIFKNNSFKDHLIYKIDNSISRGTGSIILWLAIILSLTVMVMTFLVWFSEASPEKSLSDQTWKFFEVASKFTPSENNFIHNVATFVLFITSIFVTGALTGALTTGLSEKLAKIREGHSKIIETGHVVILGWSSHVYSIVSELVIANENQKKSAVAVLGMLPKPEMLKQMAKNLPHTGKTKLLFRQGDRRSPSDLEQLSLDTAKCIIINQHSHEPSDVSKSLLAILNRETRHKDKFHIVAVVETDDDAELCDIIGKDEVEIIHTNNFLARLEAQTCRQSGLPYVYTELLNFDGDEIYFTSDPELYGKTYSEILTCYHNSAVIGFCSDANEILLNPPGDTEFTEGFQVLVISQDDDTIDYIGPQDIEVNTQLINKGAVKVPPSEHYLILGWNDNTIEMLRNLEKYVEPNSTVEIITPVDHLDELRETREFKNISFNQEKIDYSKRKILDTIDYPRFDTIILQGNNHIGIEDADTLTMATLIHLKEIRDVNNYEYSIVTELFDSKNHDLMRANQTDDFIISDAIISSAVAQIAENKLIASVFRELFKSVGSEIYLKPAEDYITLEKEMNFFTVMEAGIQKNETAIGYRIKEFAEFRIRHVGTKEMNFGVLLNPEKSEKITFTAGDMVIVLADH